MPRSFRSRGSVWLVQSSQLLNLVPCLLCLSNFRVARSLLYILQPSFVGRTVPMLVSLFDRFIGSEVLHFLLRIDMTSSSTWSTFDDKDKGRRQVTPLCSETLHLTSCLKIER